MLHPTHKPRLLGLPPLQRKIIIINGENLILRPIHKQQPRTLLFIQRAILQQRELGASLLFEPGDVGPEPEFVRECVGEIEGVLEVIHFVEPGGGEHVVASATQRYDAREPRSVRVRDADGVVSPRAKRPDSSLGGVEDGLLGYPVEKRGVESVWGGGIGRVGRTIACAWDF